MQFNFLANEGPRPRASVAVLRNDGAEVLMVQESPEVRTLGIVLSYLEYLATPG